MSNVNKNITRNENINPAMTAGNDVFALLSY